MISDAFSKTIHNWASGGKTDFKKILSMCDSLKGIGKDKTLAIIVPSFLMRKINYQKILNRSDIHTMGVNCCWYMPGCQKLTYYLPFTTLNRTRSINANPKYAAWMASYPGLAMHGMHYNDGTNPITPYPLASQSEVCEIINKCPNTKFTIWHHSWSDYVKKQGVPGMLVFPHYEKWTPRRLPWAHCGAVSGFAIPMAMALGYKNIYVVGMGYKYVVQGWHNAPSGPPKNQASASDHWLSFAPVRFKNQASFAKRMGYALKVGPSPLLEPELKNFFETFDSIEDIV